MANNKRPHFFSGRLLTAEDLSQEQNYNIGKRQLHNRALHGFGVVSGLEVSNSSTGVIIGAGIALDCEGNEIIISDAQTFAPSPQLGNTAYMSVKFKAEFIEPVPTPTGTQSSIIRDTFEIITTADNCNAKHRHARGRWISCGKAHALTLARLRRTTSGWRVDRSYRPPAVK